MVGLNSANKQGVHIRHLLQHNRITLAKPLVKQLGLKYTDEVTMNLVNGTIVIKPHISTPLAKKTHKKAITSIIKTPKKKATEKKQHRRSLKQVIGIS